MKKIFQTNQFKFPYNYKFPGQSSDEQILYLTRENRILLFLRRVAVIVAALALFVTSIAVQYIVRQIFGNVAAGLFQLVIIALPLVFLALGWWWVTTTWRKSIALVTTKRLTKFIYTTPVSRYSLSLPLEMIVDTGSYTKGFIQTFLKLGTFTARSSATSSGVATEDTGRINKKYFYIENIKKSEDLQHYVNKLLGVFRRTPEKLHNFRPFIPELKGQARANFIKDNFPQFWS